MQNAIRMFLKLVRGVVDIVNSTLGTAGKENGQASDGPFVTQDNMCYIPLGTLVKYATTKAQAKTNVSLVQETASYGLRYVFHRSSCLSLYKQGPN